MNASDPQAQEAARRLAEELHALGPFDAMRPDKAEAVTVAAFLAYGDLREREGLERAAKESECWLILSGSFIGPLYVVGFNEAIRKVAAAIRALMGERGSDDR